MVNVIVNVVLVLFGLVFLVCWAHYRRQVSAFKGLGLGIVALYLVVNVLAILLGLELAIDNAFELVALSLIDLFRLYVTVTLGCYCTWQLGHPVFPLVTGQWNVSKTESSKPSLGAYVFSVGAVVAGSVAFTYILLLITPSDASAGLVGASYPSPLLSVLASFGPDLREEVIFRLGVQSFLAWALKWRGSRYWLVIVLTAALWSMAHVNAMELYWIKLIQVFPLGLALGWLNRKYGTESSILAHGTINLLLELLLSPLT